MDEAKIKACLGDELYLACTNGNLDEVVTCLSRHQTANPSDKPTLQAVMQAMMHAAITKDRSNIVRYCLENEDGGRVDDSVMKTLLCSRAIDTYKLLLASKAVDVDYYISWYGDVLSNAAIDDDFEWAKLCLENGADPNRNLVNEHQTILAAVVENASVEMAALLLKHGAQLKDSGAVVLAAQEGRLEMVKFLLDRGANINEIGVEHPTDERVTAESGSALHKAVEGGYEELVKLLLHKGANVKLRNLKGETPLALAEAKTDSKMVKLLKAYGVLE